MITFRLTKVLFCRSALRLTLSKRWKHDVTAIRNVGIIAHIDAGKTTTTERMLYYAGLTRSVGEVHDGDTVTDFMDAERERGITINSAAITFPWKTIDKSFVVNLIDTPGHVDFTIEVERSLRVLDGGVVILDASAGVQAQTLTVWRQADAHNRERSVKVPRILFVNKMDKPNASLDMSLKSVQTRLHCDPILIQMPIGSGRDFQGVVDLITMEARTWNRDSDVTQGKSFKISSLEDGDLKERAKELRNEMVERLCEFDDDLADLVISNPDYENYDLIPNSVLMDSIRKVVLNRPGEAAITLVGSAYKNIGVQPLMDAIGNYLPSPVDIKQPFLQNDLFKGKFCGIAFKISHPTAQKVRFKHNSTMSEHPYQEENCVFCRISNGSEGTELLYSDNEYAAFRDHKPAAAHHYLVVPKKHFGKISALTRHDIPMIRRMESIGWEVLSNRAGVLAKDDAKVGFHWPLALVGHLHLHVIAPASSMSLMSRAIFSKKLFGDVANAIEVLEKQ